jgi:hypothetical protein
MRILKALIAFVVVLLLGGVIVAVGGWFMLRGVPEWYKADAITPEQREIAARNAEDMFTRMTNWAASARARRIRAGLSATTQANIAMAHEPSQPFQIQFTDQELNAFFEKWADVNGRRAFFEQYVADPRLVLRNNQLILAGTVKEMNLVVSMEFEPRIDEQGRLDMNLVRVVGGILPMPAALYARPQRKISRMLLANLPVYQESAVISGDGAANSSASAAGMNELLLSVLNGDSAQPVLFVPYDLRNINRTLPVKITALSIQNNTLTVTAEQMTSPEREAFLKNLRAPYIPQTLSATAQ